MRIVATILVVSFLHIDVFAQLGNCGNINFEEGTLNGWVGRRGETGEDPDGVSKPTPSIGCCPQDYVPVPINSPLTDTAARHTVMSAAGGNDFYGGFPVIPPPIPNSNAPAGNYSVRLGNDRHFQDGAGWQMETLEFTYTPTAANNIFTYQYAVVLNTYPGDDGHIDKAGPWFEMLVLDQFGDTLPCTYQFQTANPSDGDGSIPEGFLESQVQRPNQYNGVLYKPWTTVSMDFIAHVGQPLTIRFTTADCEAGGHFGYAYFNCECWQIKITGQDTICQGETSTLIAPLEDSTTYDWTGPGGPYTGQTIDVNQTGTYEVSMTNEYGCVKKASYDVYVNQQPTANFIENKVCEGNPVNFVDNSSVPDPTRNPIVSWEWDFGDGSTSTAQTPSHVYANAGTYTAELTVVTKWGCRDSVSIPVTVQPPPVASFSGMDVCQGVPTCFVDASSVNSGSITQYDVDYGDGTTVNNISDFCHTYTSAGNFDITLRVTSDLGCWDDTTINVTVYPYPDADFSVNPMETDIFNPDFTITDLSVGADSGSWSLGDGTDTVYVTGGQVINHTYQNIENIPGGYTYDITLDVINGFGCPNTVTKTVVIKPYWTFYIPNAFTPNGDLINDTFFGKGEGILEYEMWIFDRWGNKIFHCDIEDLPQHPLCHWDGIVRNPTEKSGLIAQQDVYVWLVKLTDIFGDKHRYIGHVSMVR